MTNSGLIGIVISYSMGGYCLYEAIKGEKRLRNDDSKDRRLFFPVYGIALICAICVPMIVYGIISLSHGVGLILFLTISTLIYWIYSTYGMFTMLKMLLQLVVIIIGYIMILIDIWPYPV